jgi:hypothetical protein
VRFAYADPPYLGLGRFYPEHPDALDCDEPEWHRALIARLVEEFPDGWALSLHAPSLRVILPMCPEEARVATWCKSWASFKPGVRPAYAWEPVVFWRGRNPPWYRKDREQLTPRDFLVTSAAVGVGLKGAKPPKFCRWVLDLLGYLDGDELVDLFPGSGIMTRVLAQGSLL